MTPTRTLVRLATLAMATCIVHGSAVARPALTCTNWISGTGVAPSTKQAQQKAKANWTAKAIATYGPSLGDFDNAQAGPFTCNKPDLMMYCTIRAKPCKENGYKYKLGK